MSVFSDFHSEKAVKTIVIRRSFLFLRAIFRTDKHLVFRKLHLYPLSRIAEETTDSDIEKITDDKGEEDDDYKQYVSEHDNHLAFL